MKRRSRKSTKAKKAKSPEQLEKFNKGPFAYSAEYHAWRRAIAKGTADDIQKAAAAHDRVIFKFSRSVPAPVELLDMEDEQPRRLSRPRSRRKRSGAVDAQERQDTARA